MRGTRTVRLVAVVTGIASCVIGLGVIAPAIAAGEAPARVPTGRAAPVVAAPTAVQALLLPTSGRDRERGVENASRTRNPHRFATVDYNQFYARTHMFEEYDWGKEQYECLEILWTKESNWNERSRNRITGAYGIPQSLPATKMSSHGPDWEDNPETQIRWGLHYINVRYGTPCKAWRTFQRIGWY